MNLPTEERPQGLHLTGLRLLASDHVVQPEHEHDVRVAEHPLVERGVETSLVDALTDRYGMPCDLLDEVLERHPGPEEQLQCPHLVEHLRQGAIDPQSELITGSAPR
ncbi:hypothetical protein [Streptomyces sp. NPDC001020]